MRGEAHDAAAAAAAIILVGERHFIVIDGDKPRIGDRRAMGVAGEIGEHARGSAERRLGVDDERALPQRAHAGFEGVWLGSRASSPKKFTSPFSDSASRPSRNRRRNAFDNAWTESRKFGLASTPRLPSRATPPPGTRQWTWG